MDLIVRYKNYLEYKAALDTELQKSTESFVRIGYMLKLARDTDILTGSGYESVNDFARAEYNIDKTLVSRFISINDRFSEGGNSDQLLEQYRGFGYSKLAIMLQLPEAIAAELSPDFSKAEVQMLKEEIDEEKKVTDLEILMEPVDEGALSMDTHLEQVLYLLLGEETELYEKVYEARLDKDKLQEALAPSGESIHSVRVPGLGRQMLSIKGTDTNISLINARSGEKEIFTWAELAWAAEKITNYNVCMEDSYKAVYAKEFPKVAPVQPVPPMSPMTRAISEKLEEMAKKQKKQSKVTKAVEKPKEKLKEETPEEPEEEQVPGQTSIESDFKELLPEENKTEFETTEAVSGKTETELQKNETELHKTETAAEKMEQYRKTEVECAANCRYNPFGYCVKEKLHIGEGGTCIDCEEEQ